MVYDFNLLISHGWWNARDAKEETARLLKKFGDDRPAVETTIARGLLGAKTILNNRFVTSALAEEFQRDPLSVTCTLKWTPIDLWCELKSMGSALSSMRSEIRPGERWMMHVEKRRYTARHKAEIIQELAALIEEKVDLKNPDKIVWIEIVGNQAGMSIMRPGEIFSLHKVNPSKF